VQAAKSTKNAERVPDVILVVNIKAAWACEEEVLRIERREENYYG
jgi:hypothetical protein